MNRLLICFSTALLAITSLAATAAPIEYNIIPRPAASRVDTAGGHFVIARGTLVVAPTAQAAQSAQYLARYCEQYLGLPLRVAASARAGEPAIELSIAGSGPHEGYTLQVDSTGIAITGNDEAGLFYGVQSLLQLLPTRAGLIPHIAAGRIDDAPRFGYRGMLLDVVRHFFPVAYIEKYIDWLALHKMNVFHWHLTDDQGWCIELKSHPELTARGSYRAGEIKGFFPGVYHDMPYQAYYTQEQVKHIIDYAAQRHVTPPRAQAHGPHLGHLQPAEQRAGTHATGVPVSHRRVYRGVPALPRPLCARRRRRVRPQVVGGVTRDTPLHEEAQLEKRPGAAILL